MAKRTTSLLVRVTVFTAFLFAMVNCGSNNSSNTTGTATTPTLTSLYSNVFGASCVQCHKPGGSAYLQGSLLDFSSYNTAYATLLEPISAQNNNESNCAGIAVVSPGNTSASLIIPVVVQYQSPFVTGSCIPFATHSTDGNALSASEGQALATWIQQGAQQN